MEKKTSKLAESGPFYADRWGDRWSERGLVLRFGDGFKSTAVLLDRATAAVLAASLGNVVRQHELENGILWSEDAPRQGTLAERQLSIDDQLESAPAAKSLYLAVKNLPLRGFEKSFKLRVGELLSNRFLVGLGKNMLAAEDLDHLASQLSAPHAVRRDLREKMTGATFIHVGFEGAIARSTYKLYLEFPLAPEAADSPATPLYIGFKWDPANNLQFAVSEYQQPRAMELPELAKHIKRVFGPNTHLAVALAAEEVVRVAIERVPKGTLPLVEVTESDSPRTSFDVNLYESGLKVADLKAILSELSKQLGIAEQAYLKVMEGAAEDQLGHISGGLDRQGKPFVTVYHARSAPQASR